MTTNSPRRTVAALLLAGGAAIAVAGALLAASPAMAQSSASAPARPAPIVERGATANGVKLHYLTAGSGDATPIVLLHGYAQTSRMWRPLMPRLAAAGGPVIAVDLRGAGGSGKTEVPGEKKLLAQDIHALTQQLGYKKVKIVGHDIGLMVAYAYAAQYPGEVEKIALLDAFLPGVGDWTKVWLLRDLWHFHFYGEVPEKLVAGRERIYFEHFWNDFAADKTKSIPEADRKFYAAAYGQPGGMHAGFGYFKAFEQDAKDFDAMSKTKLKMPMLVLTGEKASGEFLIGQARLVAESVDGRIVKGAGHWIMEESPEYTMGALVEFLK